MKINTSHYLIISLVLLFNSFVWFLSGEMSIRRQAVFQFILRVGFLIGYIIKILKEKRRWPNLPMW